MAFDSNSLKVISDCVALQTKIEEQLFKAFLPRDNKGKFIFPRTYKPVSNTVKPSDYRNPPKGHKTIEITIDDVPSRYIVEATLSDNRGIKNGAAKLRQAGLVTEEDQAKFPDVVAQRLNGAFLDLGEVTRIINLIEKLPKVEIPTRKVGNIEIPGFAFGIEVIFNEDEHELLMERYNSFDSSKKSLVQQALSDSNTLDTTATLKLRKEISEVVGLDFSGNFQQMTEKWLEANRGSFDQYAKMCKTICETNNIEIDIPTFDELISLQNPGLTIQGD